VSRQIYKSVPNLSQQPQAQEITARAAFTSQPGAAGADRLRQSVAGRIKASCIPLSTSNFNSFVTPVKIFVAVFTTPEQIYVS